MEITQHMQVGGLQFLPGDGAQDHARAEKADGVQIE
jgi:hypothetical protein